MGLRVKAGGPMQFPHPGGKLGRGAGFAGGMRQWHQTGIKPGLAGDLCEQLLIAPPGVPLS